MTMFQLTNPKVNFFLTKKKKKKNIKQMKKRKKTGKIKDK